MPLKSLCHALVSKPTNLDVMVMLVGIERLLQPVCQILDEWQHEDDHGKQDIGESMLCYAQLISEQVNTNYHTMNSALASF